ncbi:TonB-dependent siderophore receptor [Phenylobacterium sp.]|uniref:TonB-dependent siderophore receptor n=1 Tax=Phenylobacterium sp. TaxID=1871053 RepID=UPI00301CE991
MPNPALPHRLFASAALCAALAATAAEAGEAAAASGATVSEIVVTGSKILAAGAKTATPLQEVPNSITVTTREQMDLRDIATLEDLMLLTPGITVTGSNPENPSLISRGFNISNYLIDGVAGISFPGTTPDLAIYERVEILRGPAGLFSGAGSPAGSINLVRKRPSRTASASLGLSIGSWQNYRGDLDVSLPLSPGGAIRARVSGAAQEQNYFFDVAQSQRGIAYGVVEADVTPTTTLAVGGHYQTLSTPVQTGLPGYVDGGLIPLPRSTYIGAPWNVIREESHVIFADVTQALPGGWELRGTVQQARQDAFRPFAYLGNPSVTPTSGLNTLGAQQSDGETEQTSADLNLTGSVRLFGREHNLLVGADYQKQTSESLLGRVGSFFVVDVYNPTPAIPRPNLPYTSRSEGLTEQYGAYGQARLRPADRLTVVLGGRLSHWKTRSTSSSRTNAQSPWRVSPTTGYEVDGQFTPYAGVVYTIDPVWTAYLSYADTFTPQSQRTDEGDPIDPITGGQIEAGLKGAIFDGRMLLSLAAYRITQANRAQPDPDYPDGSGFYVASGEVRSTGAEIEVAGRITPDWMVAGGYAYNTNKYTKDVTNAGRPFTAISPKHSLKLWTNYRFVDGAMRGWDVGGSFSIFTKSVGDNVVQPGYAIAGVQAGRELRPGLRLQASINNLFDKVYYTRIRYTRNGNYYGEPRSYRVTLRARY